MPVEQSCHRLSESNKFLVVLSLAQSSSFSFSIFRLDKANILDASEPGPPLVSQNSGKDGNEACQREVFKSCLYSSCIKETAGFESRLGCLISDCKRELNRLNLLPECLDLLLLESLEAGSEAAGDASISILDESGLLSETYLNHFEGLAQTVVILQASLCGLAYLAGLGSGAWEDSKRRGGIVCNLDLSDSAARVSVFENAELIDYAVLGLGTNCLQFSAQGELACISESGENFLDGVAKLHLLELGSKPDPELIKLISSLIAETLAHLLCSKRLPQIASRMLESEPLRRDYSIDRYWISGLIGESSDLEFARSDLSGYLMTELPRALAERSLDFQCSKQGVFATFRGARALYRQLCRQQDFQNQGRSAAAVYTSGPLQISKIQTNRQTGSGSFCLWRTN